MSLTLPPTYADALDGPWHAFVTGRYGLLLSEEDLEAWAEDEDHLDDGLAPTLVAVGKGTSAPVDNGERIPASHLLSDRITLEEDADDHEPEYVIARYLQAREIAAALNEADVIHPWEAAAIVADATDAALLQAGLDPAEFTVPDDAPPPRLLLRHLQTLADQYGPAIVVRAAAAVAKASE